MTAAVQVSSDRAYVRAHSSPRSSANPDMVLVSGDPRGSRKCEVSLSRRDGRSSLQAGGPMDDGELPCGRLRLQASAGRGK